MKLLFDENLAPRLAALLAEAFPDSRHVHDLGLGMADDRAVWRYAREHGFAIVSKDSDFADLAVLFGPPPKIVWLRCGNCSTADLAALLDRHADGIRAFGDTAADRMYVIE